MNPRPASAWRTCAAAALLLCLVGCGGDVFVAFSFGFEDEDPPKVTMGALPESVSSGERLLLTASASDDSGFVEQVDFFRVVEGGADEFIASDFSRPYEQDTFAPVVSTPTTVEYFARAFDGSGHRRDSAAVVVTVRP